MGGDPAGQGATDAQREIEFAWAADLVAGASLRQQPCVVGAEQQQRCHLVISETQTRHALSGQLRMVDGQALTVDGGKIRRVQRHIGDIIGAEIGQRVTDEARRRAISGWAKANLFRQFAPRTSKRIICAAVTCDSDIDRARSIIFQAATTLCDEPPLWREQDDVGRTMTQPQQVKPPAWANQWRCVCAIANQRERLEGIARPQPRDIERGSEAWLEIIQRGPTFGGERITSRQFVPKVVQQHEIGGWQGAHRHRFNSSYVVLSAQYNVCGTVSAMEHSNRHATGRDMMAEQRAPRVLRGDRRQYGYPISDHEALKTKALEVTRRLTERYGVSRWSTKDPLSMLVDIILSHRTKDAQTAAAYARLRERFGTWEVMRDAPTADVEATIVGVNWPEVKAPRLQALLRRITEERGTLSLDFLGDMTTEDAAAWLERMDGVGPKTTACVLLFTLRKPILPVDTHVHRLSIRLGLIGSRVSADNAHKLLQALLPNDAQTIHDYHKGLLRHGQRVCVFDRPRCGDCPLTDLCDYYNTVVNPNAHQAVVS